MVNITSKKNRMMEIFFRAIRGEKILVKDLANEYNVSTKSISRDISEIKNFLYESRDLVGNTELRYSQSSKTYYLDMDGFLTNKELIAIIKVLISSRAFSKPDMNNIIEKLRKYTTVSDRNVLKKTISKELFHYRSVKHDCNSIIENIWEIMDSIYKKQEISIKYYKMSREEVERRLLPVNIIFSEYYFYLIALRCDKKDSKFIYYRIDRITNIKKHKSNVLETNMDPGQIEGFLNKIQYMFDGKPQTIKFEYYGKSVQAILDKIPISNVIFSDNEKYIIESEVYGDGIKMVLLSQGSNIKVLEPAELVEEIKKDIESMNNLYE